MTLVDDKILSIFFAPLHLTPSKHTHTLLILRILVFSLLGDIGYFNERGVVFVQDRLKELIKYDGLQVSKDQ